MLQGIQALLELSKVDVQIAELEDEKSALPAARAALYQEREKVQAAVEAAQVALIAAEQEQRRHEAAVADREAIVKKLEGQQHQIKTNEAYTVLLHEIDAARAAISDAETKILEAMEGIESARAALDRARAAAKGSCMGCHVTIPPQTLLELRRGQGLHTCGNCQRILVLAEHS